MTNSLLRLLDNGCRYDQVVAVEGFVDETEGLVGIVTYVDMLRCFVNRLQED